MKLVNKLLVSALFFLLVPAATYADEFIQGASISLIQPSSCGELVFDFGVFGENIDSESVKVTDISNATLLEQSITFAPQKLSGIASRKVTVPRAEGKNSGLIAVSYRFESRAGGGGSADFFSLVDCSVNREIYNCFPYPGSCPRDMSDYFPKLELHLESEQIQNGQEISFGRTFVRDDKTEYPDLSNRGVLDLQIRRVFVEGPHAAQFKIKGLPDTLRSSEYEVFFQITFEPKGKRGIRTANLHIQTNDPFQPEIVLPLRGIAALAQDLDVTLDSVKLLSGPNKKEVSCTLTVSNEGSKLSMKGAEVSVGIWDTNTLKDKYGDYKRAHVRTIFKKVIPPIKPGHALTFPIDATPEVVLPFRLDEQDELVARVRPNTREISKSNNSSLDNLE